MSSQRNFSGVKRLTVKVGTSTLTHENGNLNLRRIESLARVLSDLRNSGLDVVLVSSGAIGVGVAKMGLTERPSSVAMKQAAAAVGQPQLMEIYNDLFGKYNQTVAQHLVTKNFVTNPQMHENVTNTLSSLTQHGIIPIVNENDTVVTDEILFGDNDTLSSHIAAAVKSQLLVLLTDIDGLYDANPTVKPDAKLIHQVPRLTAEIRAMAGDSGTSRGTGGMKTKLDAVAIAADGGCQTVIMNGENPQQLYALLEGEEIGTYFGD